MSTPDSEDDLLRALPGIARIAGTRGCARRTGRCGPRATRLGRLIRSAASGESPTELFRRTASDFRGWARGVLGVVDAAAQEAEPRPAEPEPAPDDARATLRDRGAELLRRSADVRVSEEGHPAYERILDELAPDEGRILRVLVLDGPQPSVDVRAGLPMASQLVAPGRNMIGAQAGCRHLDRVPAYLNNLYRLGLVWFSRESLDDPRRYQVLEAQPDVVEAMRKAGRTGRTVRRSILLTPFGRDFCDTCLPVDAVSD